MVDIFYIGLLILICPVSFHFYYLCKNSVINRVSVDDTETMPPAEEMPIF